MPARARARWFSIIFPNQMPICQLAQVGHDPALYAGAPAPELKINCSRVPLPASITDNLQRQAGRNDVHCALPYARVIEVIGSPLSRQAIVFQCLRVQLVPEFV